MEIELNFVEDLAVLGICANSRYDVQNNMVFFATFTKRQVIFALSAKIQ